MSEQQWTIDGYSNIMSPERQYWLEIHFDNPADDTDLHAADVAQRVAAALSGRRQKTEPTFQEVYKALSGAIDGDGSCQEIEEAARAVIALFEAREIP